MSGAVDLVRRLIDEAINQHNLDVLDDPCTPALAPKLSTAFSQFRAAFRNWHQDVRELVTDERAVVARMRCTGTHHGQWQGLAHTRRRMRVDEVYFLRISNDRMSGLWGLEDTWTRMRQLHANNGQLGELGSLT